MSAQSRFTPVVWWKQIRVRQLFLLGLVLALVVSGAAPATTLAQSDANATGHSIYVPHVSSGGAPSSPNPDYDPAAIEVADVPVSEQEDAEVYWTHERLLSAESLDVLVATEEEASAAEQASEEMQGGAPGGGDGGLPDADALAVAQQLYPEAWAQLDETNLREGAIETDTVQASGVDAWSSSPPFASYYVNLHTNSWQQHPWRTIGRLYFKKPNTAGTFSCTASVAGGRAVWTAGHCVYTKGKGWHTNMLFIPADRNGNAPFGRFTVFSRNSLQGWTKDANFAYDIGMVAVRDRNGRKVSQWVGSLGWKYNLSTTQLFHAFGYPSNINSGRYLFACVGQTYSRYGMPGTDPIGIGCDMKNGSSGGPWLLAYTPYTTGSKNYINGVVSFGAASRPNQVYSPYFGDGAKSLYNWGATK